MRIPDALILDSRSDSGYYISCLAMDGNNYFCSVFFLQLRSDVREHKKYFN